MLQVSSFLWSIDLCVFLTINVQGSKYLGDRILESNKFVKPAAHCSTDHEQPKQLNRRELDIMMIQHGHMQKVRSSDWLDVLTLGNLKS